MAVPLDQLLSRMNAFLHERTQGEKYATLVYFTVSESGVLEWANAAQCRPLLLQADGKISSLETTGMPLGLLAEAEFEVRRLQLQPGDKLVAYTDGLSDAENNQGEQFGPRIRAILTAHRHEPAPRILDTLVEAVATFTEESSLSDDVTILVVEYAGSAGSNSVA